MTTWRSAVRHSREPSTWKRRRPCSGIVLALYAFFAILFRADVAAAVQPLGAASRSRTALSNALPSGGSIAATAALRLSHSFSEAASSSACSLAIRGLPYVVIYDNSDTIRPFEPVAMFADGCRVSVAERVPTWARALVRPQ